MINDQELREAVEIVSCQNRKSGNVLVSLAQSYLDIAGKMPKEKPVTNHYSCCSQCGQKYFGENESYNQARQDMLLAFMKIMPSVEEIKEKIHSGVIWNLGERYTHRPEFLSGITNEKEMLFANELAQVIHNLIMERMR